MSNVIKKIKKIFSGSKTAPLPKLKTKKESNTPIIDLFDKALSKYTVEIKSIEKSLPQLLIDGLEDIKLSTLDVNLNTEITKTVLGQEAGVGSLKVSVNKEDVLQVESSNDTLRGQRETRAIISLLPKGFLYNEKYFKDGILTKEGIKAIKKHVKEDLRNKQIFLSNCGLAMSYFAGENKKYLKAFFLSSLPSKYIKQAKQLKSTKKAKLTEFNEALPYIIKSFAKFEETMFSPEVSISLNQVSVANRILKKSLLTKEGFVQPHDVIPAILTYVHMNQNTTGNFQITGIQDGYAQLLSEIEVPKAKKQVAPKTHTHRKVHSI